MLLLFLCCENIMMYIRNESFMNEIPLNGVEQNSFNHKIKREFIDKS
jgi:hypothetical protein